MLDASLPSLLEQERPSRFGYCVGRLLGLAYRLTGAHRYDRLRIERVLDLAVVVLPTVANPKVQALAGRVDLQEDTSFTARYPAEQPVTVRIVMRDGAVHTGECVVTKGEPTNPHKPEELTAKFFELGEPVWGRPVTQKLNDGLMKLETIGSFRSFADEFYGLRNHIDFVRQRLRTNT